MTEDKDMATTLNNYFCSVFNETSHDSNIIVENSEIQQPNFEVSKEDVLKALGKLNPNKIPGPDRIYPKILKEIKEETHTWQPYSVSP